MSNSLPNYVNPWLLFRHHETVSGTIDFSILPNLQNSQNRQVGEANAELHVDVREDREIVLLGEACAELEFECQRCLKPLVKIFRTRFELVVVKNERQLEHISENDDAIVVEDQLELAPLIEQELILTLPMIAKHDDCQAEYEGSDSVEVENQSPFANLKDLLK